MLTRICTAVVLIVAVLAWLFKADYAIYAMGCLFMYAVSAYEMGPLLGYKSRIPFILISCICAVLSFIAVGNPGNFINTGIPSTAQYITVAGMIVWIGSLPLLIKYPHNTGWHKNLILNTIIGILLLVPFLMGLLILRASEYATNNLAGSFLVLSVMALVWCADSGAYFTGYFLGKHKMLPNVSPKKTVEGLIGGLVTALIGMYIFMQMDWFGQYADNKFALTCACVAAIVFSVIGDLVESMLKRIVGIKDSGKIFPGHGGMLDRIDSQLAAIPVFLTVIWLVSGELR